MRDFSEIIFPANTRLNYNYITTVYEAYTINITNNYKLLNKVR